LTFTEQQAVKSLLTRVVKDAGERLGRLARETVRVVRKAMEAGIGERVAKVLQAHAADAPAAGPHAGHVTAQGETGVAVHHEHSPDADQDHLGRVRADLMAIPGVTRCTQGARPPIGPGWKECYRMLPREEDDGSAGPPGGDSGEATMETKGGDEWFGPWRVERPARTPIRKGLGANCACCAEEILTGRCRC
jgi:hypothetical protein